jgi:polygalacturonase
MNSAHAVQAAIDAAHAAGGGTVVIPAGQTFMCGSVEIRSRVCLSLEPGAVLLASPNIADYINYDHLELFAKSDFCRFWIFSRDAEQVTIEGPGTLDGNSPAFTVERLETHTVARSPRAQSVVFLGCQDVAVRNLRVVNTPSWAIRSAGCDRVLIENVTILNDLGLVNSDGIDVDCSRSVRIANCHIEAGDDAISIKGRREIAAQYGACEDIVVTGCTLESHCCAFRLGVESYVDFRRIVFSNSTIRRSHRGIAIDCRDESVVEDVLFSDLAIDTIHSPRIWWHQGEAIWIVQVPYVPGHYGGDSKVAMLRNIVFRNIAITTEQGVYVQGADGENAPSDIYFDSVHVHVAKHTKHPAGFFDPRPNRPGFTVAGSDGIEESGPHGTLFRHKLPAFFFDRAANVTLRNCRVTWAPNMPDPYSHAIEAWNTPGLSLENFHGSAAGPEIEDITIHSA